MSPPDYFWLSLLLKAALTSTIIVTASLIVERGGPFLGAMIASLPTSVGAAYIVMAIEHSPDFISNSALGSLTANAAGVTFAAAYALLARKNSLLVGLGGALLIWLACATALRQIDFTLSSAIALNLAVAAVAIWATAKARAASFPKAAIVRRAYDIPLRAAAVSAFVIIVTTLSHSIGAFASGVFAVFPIAMSSFIVILHNRIGGPATSNVIAHAQVPMLGLIPAFIAVYLLTIPLGVWWALLIALMASIVWNIVLWTWRTQLAARLPME
ncbi:hypothetical protein [Pseudorhodoplanes sp.]|uniref:hypothetical protein n=1 Tax=Pseudorhodoplanes sp. TaxID=1934341 RepID=UPI002BB38B4E|nr:hypothetical protein [Pseudorhodoplanes sp.]HWV53693.1 hypothetical protein [Pseudorhodoplanes sp.]